MVSAGLHGLAFQHLVRLLIEIATKSGNYGLLMYKPTVAFFTSAPLYSKGYIHQKSRACGPDTQPTLKIFQVQAGETEQMSSSRSNHSLAVQLSSSRSFGYSIEDNIGSNLGVLYGGKLYETLVSGHPGKGIILNLADTYAEISGMIFWDENDDHPEALRAFPLFAAYISETKLALIDLYNVFRIVWNFFDGEPEGSGPEHLAQVRSTVQNLSDIFREETYRNTIYAALQDKARLDFADLIFMANWFYGEDEFDLFLSYARHQPVHALFWSHWLIEMDEAQCGRFIAWARSCMPPHRLSEPVARTQEYTEAELAVLDRVLSNADHSLKNLQDRRDFIIWGLSSTNERQASAAVWLLEDMPSSQWPEGSMEIIAELFESMEPHWTSWKKKEDKYVKAKDRLGELIHVRVRHQ